MHIQCKAVGHSAAVGTAAAAQRARLPACNTMPTPLHTAALKFAEL